LNKPGKFDRNMEKVYALLKKLCANGPIEIGNSEIAQACGFKTPRQVKRYIAKLKIQGRVFVRVEHIGFHNGVGDRGCRGWLNKRYIHTKSEI
jgi:hypothetical protein